MEQSDQQRIREILKAGALVDSRALKGSASGKI